MEIWMDSVAVQTLVLVQSQQSILVDKIYKIDRIITEIYIFTAVWTTDVIFYHLRIGRRFFWTVQRFCNAWL